MSRTSWRAKLLVALLLVVSSAPVRAADAIWQVLPFAGLMRKDLDVLSDEALTTRAEALRQRLFIDEETVALERGEDLELVVGYAAMVALVAERQGTDAVGVAGASRSAAFLLHATGFMAETRADLRIAIAELGALDEPAPRALATSVRAMRAFGRERFEAAFAAGGTVGAGALAQAGRIALREGDAMLAAQSFMAAAAKEPLPRFAVAACEALLRVANGAATALCERLDARFVATFPASAGRFAEVRREVDDDLRSKDFDARAKETLATLDELSAETWRRVRQAREGAAERLARVATERFADVPAAWEMAAAVALELGHWKELERLLSVATGRGMALPEVRLAAEARLAVEALLGSGKAPRKKDDRALGAVGALDKAIDALVKVGGRAELELQLRVLAALQAQVTGEVDSDKRLDAAWLALIGEKPDKAAKLAGKAAIDADSANLALIVALARDRWQTDAPRVLARLAGPVRVTAEQVVQSVELGLALRGRDRERLDKAARALATPGEGGAWELARVVARRGREVLAGGPIDNTQLAEDRRTLAALAFAFDEATPDGRRLAQARALTLATLEARTAKDGGVQRAIELLREARRFGGELAPLAGGLGQLLAGDTQGAEELCGRANSDDASLRQALAACQALGSPEAEAHPLWALVDKLWDAAGVPPVLQPGTARPLALTDFAIAVTVADGRPLALSVTFTPVALLVPEVVPTRVEVRKRARP